MNTSKTIEAVMWKSQSHIKKTDLAIFIINQLVEKINQERLLVNPKDILDIANIALLGADIELPIL